MQVWLIGGNVIVFSEPVIIQTNRAREIDLSSNEDSSEDDDDEAKKKVETVEEENNNGSVAATTGSSEPKDLQEKKEDWNALYTLIIFLT